MKYFNFIDNCTEFVQSKINGVYGKGEKLRLPIRLTLEEVVQSTDSNDDFYHWFNFTLDYPGSDIKTLSDTRTMSENRPISREDLDYIKDWFSYLSINSPNLKIEKQILYHDKNRYKGMLTIAYNQ